MKYSFFVTCFILFLFFQIPADAKKFSFSNRAWNKIPAIVIVGSDEDPRFQAALEAIEFWNTTFSEIGSPFHLGTVTHRTQEISYDDYLSKLSKHVLEGRTKPRMPKDLRTLPEDLIILFSDVEIISFSSRHPSEGKVIVGIRSHLAYPLILPNVKRNLVAHELGHAIGLGHNDDPTKLMCGRPAPCRPSLFESQEPRFFPLTDQEKQQLLKMYPPEWKGL